MQWNKKLSLALARRAEMGRQAVIISKDCKAAQHIIREYAVLPSYDEMANLILKSWKGGSKPIHFYEYVDPVQPCRIYFDLEYKKSINAELEAKGGIRWACQKVILLVLETLRRMGYSMEGRFESKTDVLVEDSSDAHKASAHIKFPRFIVDNNQLIKGLARQVNQLWAEDAECPNILKEQKVPDVSSGPILVESKLVDEAVYSKNQTFRTLLSSKMADPSRPFKYIGDLPYSTPDQQMNILKLSFLQYIVSPSQKPLIRIRNIPQEIPKSSYRGSSSQPDQKIIGFPDSSHQFDAQFKTTLENWISSQTGGGRIVWSQTSLHGDMDGQGYIKVYVMGGHCHVAERKHLHNNGFIMVSLWPDFIPYKKRVGPPKIMSTCFCYDPDCRQKVLQNKTHTWKQFETDPKILQLSKAIMMNNMKPDFLEVKVFDLVRLNSNSSKMVLPSFNFDEQGEGNADDTIWIGNPNHKVIGIKAMMGVGKTHQTISMIQQQPMSRICYIANRQTQTDDWMKSLKDLGFLDYREMTHSEAIQADRLIISPESAWKLLWVSNSSSSSSSPSASSGEGKETSEDLFRDALISAFDMIIIDEIHSFTNHFCKSPTMDTVLNMPHTTDKRCFKRLKINKNLREIALHMLLKKAHKVIIMDAFLRPHDMEYIHQICKNPHDPSSNKSLLYVQRKNTDGRNYFIYRSNQPWCNKLLDFVRQGKKVALFCDTKEEVRRMEAIITQSQLPVQMEAFYSGVDVDKRELLSDTDNWKVGLFMASPVVGAGMDASYAQPHFDHIFIHHKGTTLDTEGVLQLSYRVRQVISDQVHVCVPTNHHSFIFDYRSIPASLKKLAYDEMTTEFYSMWTDADHYYLRLLIQKEITFKQTRDFTEARLVRLLNEMGASSIQVVQDENSVEEKQSNHDNKNNQEYPTHDDIKLSPEGGMKYSLEQIQQTPEVDHKQLDALHNKINNYNQCPNQSTQPTPAEIKVVEVHRFLFSIGMKNPNNISQALLDRWDNNRAQKQLQQFKFLLMAPSQLMIHDLKLLENNKHAINNRRSEAVNSLNVLLGCIKLDIVEVLSTEPYQWEGGPTSKESVDELINKLHSPIISPHWKFIQSIWPSGQFPTRQFIEKAKNPKRILFTFYSNLLRVFGIKLVSERQRSSDNNDSDLPFSRKWCIDLSDWAELPIIRTHLERNMDNVVNQMEDE